MLTLEGNATHNQAKWLGRKCNQNHTCSFEAIGAKENIKQFIILRALGYAQFRICSTHSKKEQG